MRRRCISFLTGLVLLFIFAISGTALASRTSDAYASAMELLENRQYEEAKSAFEALGGYSDSSRYAMYCGAVAAGEKGMYSLAVTNLLSLEDFLDSSLLAVYFTGLSQEALEDYESAENTFAGILLYRDVMSRVSMYPEKKNRHACMHSG